MGVIMKYNYYISASGNLNEEKIVEILETEGLYEIFVEKILDVESFIEEQSNAEENGLLGKWQKICERKDINNAELQEMVTNKLKQQNLLTKKILAETISNCCEELDLSEGTAALTLCKVFENL